MLRTGLQFRLKLFSNVALQACLCAVLTRILWSRQVSPLAKLKDNGADCMRRLSGDRPHVCSRAIMRHGKQ